MNATFARSSLFLLLLFVATLAVPLSASEEEPLQNPALKRLYPELRRVFHRHYPRVTSHVLRERIHFEHDTRVFIVHEAYKTGEWQDPREERGPKPGGILCDITLQKGHYQGAADVPQTFDKRYFKVLLMAPYSPKQAVHLHVYLSYPRKVPDEFLRQFTDLVSDFGKYVD